MRYDNSSFTGYIYTVRRLLGRYLGGIELRGLRKVVLAAMFITVALVYIGQLAIWGIFTPITPQGAQLTATPLSTLAAALPGILYLWQAKVSHPIEVTILAIACEYFIERSLVSFIYEATYSYDIDWGDSWLFVSYIIFFLALSAAYIVSYGFFVGWRTQYRSKLIVALALVAIAMMIHGLPERGM